ncbi:MAG: HD domain-containing protein [Bacilli bacterium]
MKIIGSIEELILNLKQYNNNEDDISFVKKAYYFAEKKHKNQFRLSGEKYIIHPLNVAEIIVELKLSVNLVCAALLHDTLEDCDVTEEEIENKFGKDILYLVKGMTKMNLSKTSNKDAENFKKILLSIVEDIRIIVLKLADRLHNMNTMEFMPLHKQFQKSTQTMEVFVKTAKMLGMYRIKCELEDLCFLYLEKNEYEKISFLKQKFITENKAKIDRTVKDIKKLTNLEVQCSYLNNYGIYKKLNSGYTIDSIIDLVSIKILALNKMDCYKILGIVHSKYSHMTNKIKDYISIPKLNGFSSILTTIFGKDRLTYNIQICTKKMDNINVHGVIYELKTKPLEELTTYIKKNYNLIENIDMLSDNSKEAIEFVDDVKTELFSKNVYVYTFSGDIIKLKAGSTILDFAFEINENLGFYFDRAVVNFSRVDVTYKPQNRDIIKIFVKEKLNDKLFLIENVETKKAINIIKNKVDLNI